MIKALETRGEQAKAWQKEPSRCSEERPVAAVFVTPAPSGSRCFALPPHRAATIPV
jgi:hypothetical protein